MAPHASVAPPSKHATAMLVVISLAFLIAHVAFLARSPDTVDSVNFLLGVREFNVADHRPHPPGYPVFIALGKLSTFAFDAAAPAADPQHGAVRALALWGALLGAVGVLVLFQFFRKLEMDDRLAVAAAVLTVTCPLFWFNAGRPMSDVPGLVAALSAQALLVTAFRRYQGAETEARGLPAEPMLLIGALLAGLAIGFRTQNVWLTVPLSIWIATRCRLPLKSIARMTVMFSAGLMLWAAPTVLATGGPAAYIAAFSAQGYEDIAGADLLATSPTPDRLVTGLIHTFAYPWGHTALAASMLGLGLVGAATMLARSRPSALLLGAAAVPYGAFHLIFQESMHTRYALPLIPAVAYLAVRGLQTFAARTMPWLVAGMAAACVVIAVPPLVANARYDSPAYEVLDDLRARASGDTTPRVLAMHHAVARMLRGQEAPVRALPVTPRHEWLALVNHWRTSPDTPVWFLAEAGRHDLALVDPTSRRLIRSYTWSFPRKFLMGRIPRDGLLWYEVAPPGWMAAEGWSLSYESAGVAWQDRAGPSERPIVALVRRRDEAAVLMVGGRNTSGAGGPTARFELSIAGRPIDSWDVPSDQTFFLRMMRLPAGTLSGAEPYLPLVIRTTGSGADPRRLQVAIEQFDLQPTQTVVYGFDAGWYEQEYDGAAPQPWRWLGPSGNLRVHHAGRDLTLHVTGEVPLEQLPRAPHVSVRAGAHVLAQFATETRTVEFRVEVPAHVLDQSGGILTIDSDASFVPHDLIGNGDRRRLALRLYRVDLGDGSRDGS